MPTPETKAQPRIHSVAQACDNIIEAIMKADEDEAFIARRALTEDCGLRWNSACSYIGRRVTLRVLRKLEEFGYRNDQAKAIIAVLVKVRNRPLTGAKLVRANALTGVARESEFLPHGGFGSEPLRSRVVRAFA